MNEDLTERFGRGNAFRQSNTPPPPSRPPMVVNQSIRQYVKTFDRPVNLLHWTGYRDIPSAEEIFDSGNRNLKEDVLVPDNTVVGPYESREDYLERHYALLREDAVAPLRSVVSEVQEYPLLEERESDTNANIYEKVGIHFSNVLPQVFTMHRFSLRALPWQTVGSRLVSLSP